MQPTTTVSQVQNCSFAKWYPQFKSVTLKSVVIPLTEEFVGYLNADGLFLPLDRDGNDRSFYKRSDEDDNSDCDDQKENLVQPKESSTTTTDDDEEDDTWGKEAPQFPELDQAVSEAIAELGGAVFPKLNWSSPKDASWMSMNGTLKCTSFTDILLLIKSSDFVSHDLSHAFSDCVRPESDTDESPPTRPETYHLVLRKWHDLHTSLEFRCFVRDGELIAISQRDYRNHYPFLFQMKETLEDNILRFYNDKIKGKFPDPSFVFDVYVNKGNQRVWLIDFNPFSKSTDALLFLWSELLQSSEAEANEVTATNGLSADSEPLNSQTPATNPTPLPKPAFRLTDANSASTSIQPMYATNMYPREAIEFSQGQTVQSFLQRVQDEVRRAS